MTGRILNDNGSKRGGGSLVGSDPHGQAALLLVESLIHGLIAQSLISVAQAIDIVDVAVDVSGDLATDQNDLSAVTTKSVNLLQKIGVSLSGDLPSD